MQGFSEAIAFYDGDEIAKEMYFTEFEAVMDDVVGIPDFAGREIGGVYLQIDGSLRMRGAVFFRIAFDHLGRIDGEWDLPLRLLMAQAEPGPDLGHGPIYFASEKYCRNLQNYQPLLWQPGENGGKHLANLVASLQRNRLGILGEESEAEAIRRRSRAAPIGQKVPGELPIAAPVAPVSTPPSPGLPVAAPAPGVHFNRKYRQRRLQWLADHEAALDSLAQGFDKKRSSLQSKHRQEKKKLETTIRNHEDSILRLSEKIAQFDKVGDAKLGQREGELRDRITELEQSLAIAEKKAAQRESELYHRATEIVALRRQLGVDSKRAKSAKDRRALVAEMAERGVSFHIATPGVPETVLQAEELAGYLDDPDAFVAAQCEVEIERYKAWLAHFHLPVCLAEERGEICGQGLNKVDSPQKFVFGRSDRCERHREAG